MPSHQPSQPEIPPEIYREVVLEAHKVLDKANFQALRLASKSLSHITREVYYRDLEFAVGSSTPPMLSRLLDLIQQYPQIPIYIRNIKLISYGLPPWRGMEQVDALIETVTKLESLSISRADLTPLKAIHFSGIVAQAAKDLTTLHLYNVSEIPPFFLLNCVQLRHLLLIGAQPTANAPGPIELKPGPMIRSFRYSCAISTVRYAGYEGYTTKHDPIIDNIDFTSLDTLVIWMEYPQNVNVFKHVARKAVASLRTLRMTGTAFYRRESFPTGEFWDPTAVDLKLAFPKLENLEVEILAISELVGRSNPVVGFIKCIAGLEAPSLRRIIFDLVLGPRHRVFWAQSRDWSGLDKALAKFGENHISFTVQLRFVRWSWFDFPDPNQVPMSVMPSFLDNNFPRCQKSPSITMIVTGPLVLV